MTAHELTGFSEDSNLTPFAVGADEYISGSCFTSLAAVDIMADVDTAADANVDSKSAIQITFTCYDSK